MIANLARQTRFAKPDYTDQKYKNQEVQKPRSANQND